MRLYTFAFLSASLCSAGTAVAQNNVFLGPANTPTDWMDPTAWSLGQVPDLGNNYVQLWDYRHATIASGADITIGNISLGSTSSKERASVTQSGGALNVLGQMTMSAPTAGDPSIYTLAGGEFTAASMRMRYGARFVQSGGEAWFGTLQLGEHDASFESRYLLTGGSLFVDRDMFFKNVSNNEYGVLDLGGGGATVETGDGSWVTFGSQSIANAQNGSLVVGGGSLVQVEAGMDLSSLFGTVQLNGSVVHTLGTTLEVAAGERVLLGATNHDFEDGLVVHGYAGERFYTGGQFFTDTFAVYAGGHVDMGRSGYFVLDGEAMGVFGGTAEMRGLSLRGSSSNDGEFTLDGGVLRVNGVVSHANSYDVEMIVTDGLFEADRLETKYRFNFTQQGGVSRFEEMRVAGGSQTRLLGGVVDVDLMYTSQNLAEIQHGGAQVRVGELNIFTQSTYRFTGSPLLGGSTGETADLLIREGLFVVGLNPHTGYFSKMDFAGQARTVYAEGAIIDLSYDSAQPFLNAQNATLILDEHSLLVVAPGIDLHAIFGTFVDDGIVHVLGNQLTIAADREVRGGLSLPSGADIYGRVVADRAMKANRITVRPGAFVDLGGGLLESWPDGGVGTRVLGGEVRAEFMHAADYYQDAGIATFGQVGGTHLKLPGGVLTVAEAFEVTELDYQGGDGQLVIGPGAYALLRTVTDGGSGRLHVSENALVQFWQSTAVPSNLFGEITGPGLVHVAGQTLTIPTGFMLHGELVIDGDTVNHGEINPGNKYGRYQEDIGVLRIAGDYTQTSDGVLRIELAYNEDAIDADHYVRDYLEVTGDAMLDGRLDVIFRDGFVPQPEGEYEVLSSSTIAGSFTNTTADGRLVTPWGTFAVEYTHRVTLYNFVPGVWGDLDGDGFVGVTDLDLLLANWGEGVRPGDVSLGDWNGDGVIDAEDSQVVLSNWGEGEPPDGPLVPEPGTLALLGLCLLGRRRLRC